MKGEILKELTHSTLYGKQVENSTALKLLDNK